MQTITYIIGFLVLSIVFLYFSGKYYLRESFESPAQGTKQQLVKPDRPFVENPNQGIDDYEYSLVFQNEGSRVAGKREISDAMSRYPLSWTNRPPSDEKFQTYREAFVDASQKTPAQSTVQFNSISGNDMTPPDTQRVDEEERRILATYKPEKAQDLLHYSVDDVKTLVKKIYSKRGEIATVEKSKQGSNVYEIVEVRPEHEKIVWEDEVERDPVERYALRGEEQLVVPKMATDVAAGLDPFYEPRMKVRMDRHDYTVPTAELERQFQPTYTGPGWQ